MTAQIYDTNTSTVIGSRAFTLSSTQVTETITLTTGSPAADVPDLAVRMVWHQTAVGYATVQHSYAEISYSYSDSVGSLTIDPAASIPAPQVSVAPFRPPAGVRRDYRVQLHPVVRPPTTAGDLLLGVGVLQLPVRYFRHHLLGPVLVAGRVHGCAVRVEVAVVQTPAGRGDRPRFRHRATEPLSQLLEFSGVYALDQVAGGNGTPGMRPTPRAARTPRRGTWYSGSARRTAPTPARRPSG